MIHEIQTTTPLPPEQRVVLDLSVEEFAVLYALAYECNGGPPNGLRGDVDKGLKDALESLDPGWRAKVAAAVQRSAENGYAAQRVERAFRGEVTP